MFRSKADSSWAMAVAAETLKLFSLLTSKVALRLWPEAKPAWDMAWAKAS